MFDFLSSDLEKVLVKARKLRSQGKTERAIRTIEGGLRGEAEDFELLLELGRMYFEGGRTKEACSSIKRAYSLVPSREKDILGLVEDLHYAEGKSVETAELLLELHTERREFEEAEKALTSLDPRGLDDLAERYEAIYEEVKHKPFNAMNRRDIRIHYGMALIFEQKEELEKAYPIFEKILEVDPNEAKTLVGEGRRISQSRYGEARPHLFLGDLHLRLGEDEEATRELKKAAELEKGLEPEVAERLARLVQQRPSPSSIEALIDLYTSQSRFDEAIDLVEKLVEIDPSKVDDAIRKHREILRLDPDNLRAHLSLADVYLTRDRTDQALGEFSQALELDPQISARVVERLQSVMKKEPTNPLAITSLADAYLKSGEVDKAALTLKAGHQRNPSLCSELIPALEEILERDLENAEGTALLAEVHWTRGEVKRSLSLYEHLLTLGDYGAFLASEALSEVSKANPSNTKLQVLLGIALVSNKDFEHGLRQLRGVLKREGAEEVISGLDTLVRRRPQVGEGVVTIYKGLAEEGVDPFLLNFASGEAHVQAGNLTEAVECFERCLAIDETRYEEVREAYERVLREEGGFAPARFALAALHARKGKVAEAILELESTVATDETMAEAVLKKFLDLLKLDQANPKILKAAVNLMSNMGMYREVVSYCERALKTLPPEETGYFQLKLGEAYLARGLLTKATTPLARAMELDPSLAGETIPLFGRVLSFNAANIQARYSLARAYLWAEDYQKAVMEFSTIAKVDPSKTDRVIRELDRILSLDPTNAPAHYAKGSLLMRSEGVREAIGEFERSLELEPESLEKVIGSIRQILKSHEGEAAGYLALGRALIKKELYHEATQNLSKALSLDETMREPVMASLFKIVEQDELNTSARFVLHDVLKEEGEFSEAVGLLREIEEIDEGERERVVKLYEDTCTLDPSNISVRYALASSYVKLSREEEGVGQYEAIMELSPEDTDSVISELRVLASTKNRSALLSLARALTKTGEYREATEVVAELAEHHPDAVDDGVGVLCNILSLSPQRVEPSILLSKLHLLKENYGQARKSLEKALMFSEDPTERSELYLNLALALYRMGEGEGAKEAFGEAKQLVSDPSDFYKGLERLRSERLSFQIEKASASLAESPGDLEQEVWLASLLREAGRTRDAVERLSFSSRDDRVQKLRALELASCRAEEDDLSGGVEVLRGLEISDPPSLEDKEIMYSLALLYERMGDYARAASALRTLAAWDHGYKGVAVKLEDTYEKLVSQNLLERPRVIEGISRIL